jgi:Zn-dependent protease with chaperone function
VIAPLALGAFAVLVGVAVPRQLSRARWPQRSPRLGVAAWLVFSFSTALSAVLALAMLAVPASVAGHGLSDWWHARHGELRHFYGDNNLTVVGVAGIAVGVVLARLAYTVAVHQRAVTRLRRRQHDGLTLFAAGADDLIVVPHPVPAAYCVPGRRGRVVMTDSAVQVLAADQVDAVVAHERAHLSGRHAFFLGAAAVLERAFGGLVPVFARSHREIADLVEMIADDAAVRACPRLRVAEALLTLARGRAPLAALAANGSDLPRRIRRLTVPQRPLGLASTLAMLAALTLALATPLAAVAGPVATAAVVTTCTNASH